MSPFVDPPEPNHVPGTQRGEALAREKGREPGRSNQGPYRTARDSTSIDPAGRGPIDPRMPSLPPA